MGILLLVTVIKTGVHKRDGSTDNLLHLVTSLLPRNRLTSLSADCSWYYWTPLNKETWHSDNPS